MIKRIYNPLFQERDVVFCLAGALVACNMVIHHQGFQVFSTFICQLQLPFCHIAAFSYYGQRDNIIDGRE